MKTVLRWAVAAAAVLVVVSGMATAGASTPSLSALIVPAPHGFHVAAIDKAHRVAYWDNCDVHRFERRGSEMHLYVAGRVPTSILLVCITRLPSARAATTIEGSISEQWSVFASAHAHETVAGGNVGLFTVSGIPNAAGFVSGTNSPFEKQISFATGRYVVSVVGFGKPASANLAPSLARQQYARLR